MPTAVLLADEGLRAQVVDSEGQAVGNAWLRMLEAGGSSSSSGWRTVRERVRADSEGRARLARDREGGLRVASMLPDAVVLSTAAAVTETRLKPFPVPLVERRLQVYDPAGNAVANAVVTAGSAAFPVGRTDGAGRLVLSRTTPGPLIMDLMTADGRAHREFLGVWDPGKQPGPQAVRIEFPRLGVLNGRVLDARSGQALEGALIWPLDDPGRFVRSGADGRYRLTLQAAKEIRVCVAAEGYLQESWVVEATPRARQNVRLEPAAELSGIVRDAVSGQPLDGVMVEAARHGAPSESSTPSSSRASTDEFGTFLLHGLEPHESIELDVRREGYVTSRRSVGIGRASGAPRRVDLEMYPQRPGHGQVIDAEGRPVAGARVSVVPSGADPTDSIDSIGHAVNSTQTDEAGHFLLARLPAMKVDLSVRREGFSPSVLRRVVLTADLEPFDFGEIVLRQGLAIAGRVTDLDGEPLAGARLWLVDLANGSPDSVLARARVDEPETETDASGRFGFLNVSADEGGHLVADAKGYLPKPLLGVRAPAQGLQISLERAAQVSGRVTDSKRQAVAGARLSLQPKSPAGVIAPTRQIDVALTTFSDAEGRFEFSEVSPGYFELTVEAAGFIALDPWPIEVPVGASVDRLEIGLQAGAWLLGMVRDPADEPVVGAVVTGAGAKAVSDHQGRYRLEGLEPGWQPIALRHPDYERTSRTLEIRPAENRASFVLQAGLSVHGQVTSDSGSALADVSLRLLKGGDDPRRYSAVTDGTGRFVVEGVVAGTYDVGAERHGYAPALIPGLLKVDGSPVQPVEIQLSRGATLRGWVLGLSNEELSRVEVDVERREGGGKSGGVDHQGRYEVVDLAPGDYRIRARIPGERQAEVWATVAPGDRGVRQDVEFGGGSKLTGRVTFDGSPVAGGQVSLLGLSVANSYSVWSDYQGWFQFDDLKPGNYRLEVRSPREAITHHQDLELVSDRHLDLELEAVHFSGTIVSSDSGQPLGEAAVSLRRLLDRSTQSGSRLTVTTASSGRFRFARLAPGRYELTVSRRGFLTLQEAVDFREGEGRDGVVLDLRPTSDQEFVIRLASGEIPAFAVVSTLDERGRPGLTEARPLDSQGVGLFTTLPRSAHHLLVTVRGGAATVVTRREFGEPIEMILPLAGRLRVEVPELRQSSELAEVRIERSDGGLFEVVESSGIVRQRWTLLAGSVTVEDLPAGTWHVHAERFDGRRWQRLVTTSGTGDEIVQLD